jgi:cytochrome P450
MEAQHSSDATNVATPRGGSGVLGALLRSQGFLAFGARTALSLTSIAGRPLRLGSLVIAARHADVSEVLSRDLDFLIAPINEGRIEEVNGPFVLGMDRATTLAREREILYSALAQVDRGKLARAVSARADEAIARAASGSLDVVDDYARPIAAATARALFGLSGQDDDLFMDVARAIFAHTFLNLGGDKAQARALKAGALMRQWFEEEIRKRRQPGGELGDDMMGALLKMLPPEADDCIRRTLGGMLVGSIDTTATAVAKIVAILADDAKLRERISADRNDPAILTMWCLEALRRWPHNPLLLRRAAVDTTLGGVEVKSGDTVVALTQAAMLDPKIFPAPDQLRPDRPRAAYLHYGGGLHPCAGRAINDFQITTLVGKLLERGIASAGQIIWAGPFPDRLVVQFTRRGP